MDAASRSEERENLRPHGRSQKYAYLPIRVRITSNRKARGNEDVNTDGKRR